MPFFVFTRSVCTLFMRAHRTHTHTHTHVDTDGTVKGRDSRRTLHTPVLLLCKWIILFIVISYLCIQIIFLPRLCSSDRSNAASRLQPHPPTPPTPSLYEGPKMFSKSSFLRVSVRCKKRGDVNVIGWVWVCVVCGIVKRLWESFGTHLRRFLNGTSKRTQRATCTLQRALRWDNASANNSLNYTESLFNTVMLFMFFFSSVLHGNSDLSVKTSPNIRSVSDQDFIALRAGLWANHLLHDSRFDEKWPLPPK